MTAYAIFTIVTVIQLALLAQAADLLGGHAGRVGVSSVLCAAIAAYCYAILTTSLGFSPWGAAGITLTLISMIGVLLGTLLLQLRGNDFLLGTIAAQLAFVELANNVPALGGPLGIREIPSVSLFVANRSLDPLWLLVPSALIVNVFLHATLRKETQTGRLIHWIRDDEVSVRSLGVNPQNWLIVLFVSQSIMAGVAGMSVVMLQGYVSPESFDLWLSLSVLTVVYLSGTGGQPIFIYLGAGLLVAAGEFVRSFGQFPELVGPAQRIVVSLILIAILSFQRRGLAGPVVELGPSAVRSE